VLHRPVELAQFFSKFLKTGPPTGAFLSQSPFLCSGCLEMRFIVNSATMPKSSRRQSFQHLVRTTEPQPFLAAQVSGHRRLLIEHLLRPFAGFGVASLGRKHAREIQVRLRRRRFCGHVPEECISFFSLSRLRVGVGKQSCRAMEIIVGLFRDDSFQVG